ncbi:MAG: hypothetical protein KF869_06675 [Phycisphaeraceae bacterium]|nr:hypothetical protein [Phycisphaeraceae bacterium]
MNVQGVHAGANWWSNARPCRSARIVEPAEYSDSLRDQNARRDGGTPAAFAPASPSPLHAHLADARRLGGRAPGVVSARDPGPAIPLAAAQPRPSLGTGLAPRLGEIPPAPARPSPALTYGPRSLQVTSVLVRGFRLDLLA